MAKCVVRRKIGFNIDKNSNVSGFRKKMARVLEQADIMKLRSALAGDTVVVPKHFKLPEEDLKPTRLESNDIDIVPHSVDPLTFLDSNGNSPNLSVDQDEVRPPEDRPDNMPVISCMESPDKIIDKEVEQKKKTTSAAKRQNQLLERKFFSSKPIPPPVIPRDHSKSFQGKIPKQKACKPKWERNGKLWQWALTVDNNGQFSRYVYASLLTSPSQSPSPKSLSVRKVSSQKSSRTARGRQKNTGIVHHVLVEHYQRHY